MEPLYLQPGKHQRKCHRYAVLHRIGSIVFIPVVKYVAWLAPLIIYLVEKNSQFVKFHAMQAFLLNIIGAVLSFLVSIVLGAIMAASYYS